jgi:hypothetical protein
MLDCRMLSIAGAAAFAIVAALPAATLADEPVGATPKQEQPGTIQVISVADLAKLLQDNGYRAKIVTNKDQKYIVTGLQGVDVDVIFYDCKDDKCGAIQFAIFGKTDKVNAQFANKWNLDWRYTKIALDTDGTFYMTMDMALDGGITTANILADLSLFDDSIARLKQ